MTQKGRYGKYIQALCTIIDFMVINMAYFAICLMDGNDSPFGSRIVWLLANFSYIPVVIWFPNYRQIRAARMETIVGNALRAVGLHALSFLSLLFLMSIDTIPVLTYLKFYGICFVALPMWWVLTRVILRYYRRRGRNFTRVIIVGTNSTSVRLYDELMSESGYGYRVVGFFGLDPSIGMPEELYRGDFNDIKEFVALNNVDEIFYTLSGTHENILRQTIKIANDNVIQFYYVPQISRYIAGRFELHRMGAVPMLTLNCNPLKRPINRLIKRVFDIVFSSCVLLCLGPLLLIPIAIAVKLSSRGPVFFKQKRTGYRGLDFYCWKFRTMRVNNDSDKLQATKDDPRKTRVGDFLRRTSLDELPQFFNVWLGQMSVVGPRPHMLKHTEEYRQLIDKYMVRHNVKPGISGWAQVNGYRGRTEELWQMEKRVEYDVWYIENWSFMLDLKIIVRTLVNAFQGEKNAF